MRTYTVLTDETHGRHDTEADACTCALLASQLGHRNAQVMVVEAGSLVSVTTFPAAATTTEDTLS